MSSRHLLSYDWQPDGVSAWPRARPQRGPLPRLRLSVRPGPRLGPACPRRNPPAAWRGPRPRPACPRRNPPAAWRGVARAHLPSWATFHSAPQAGGGGLVPRLPGGDVTEKRILRDAGGRRLRLSVRVRAQNAPFRRVRFSSPAQTRSHLTQRRILRRRPRVKAQSAPVTSRKGALCAGDAIAT